MNAPNPLSFSALGLCDPLLRALEAQGFKQPTPIQAQSIPVLLEGKDVLGTAQTGTGKTAAFALPVLHNLKPGGTLPQALVLVPTRELAIQVTQAFSDLSKHVSGLRTLAVYGGQDMQGQLKTLRRGVDVVVGTPGRVMDHLRRGTLKLDDLKTLILDEADEMLRMGFIDDVTWILQQAPEQKQVALFSATMPSAIRRVAQSHLPEAVHIEVASSTEQTENIEQFSWVVRQMSKLDGLCRLLEFEETDGVIIFVRTKQLTVELAERLDKFGFRSAAINGDMNQALRERTIAQLKSGKIDILIATDVAARGIDVARISHVFNYDVPFDSESYVHRIGRTGRAGRQGKAIVFLHPREQRCLRGLERATKSRIQPLTMPTQEAVNEKRVAAYKEKIIKALEKPADAFFTDIAKEVITQTGCDPVQLVGVLAKMAQQHNPVRLPGRSGGASGYPKGSKESEAGKRSGHREGGQRQAFVSGAPSRRSAARGEREKSTEQGASEQVVMERFRLHVGRKHQVKPGDIVGAIANEADIDSRYIGQIILHDEYSTVDLPKGMPEETFLQLKQTYIRQQKIKIERAGSAQTLTVGQRRSGKRKPNTAQRKSRRG